MVARETRVGYKPNHISFGRFILSEQARRPVIQAAYAIAALAAATTKRSAGEGPHLADGYKVNTKSAPVIAGDATPRVGAEVYNETTKEGETESYAAAHEFGRGPGDRKSPRPLGRAGAAISGDPDFGSIQAAKPSPGGGSEWDDYWERNG